MRTNSILILIGVVSGLSIIMAWDVLSEKRDRKAGAAEKPTVIESLPEPDQNAILQIRIADRNPFVMVCPDGYELMRVRSKADDDRIEEENREALNRVFELHQIRTSLWPSA
jgi:hypothetical protein